MAMPEQAGAGVKAAIPKPTAPEPNLRDRAKVFYGKNKRELAYGAGGIGIGLTAGAFMGGD